MQIPELLKKSMCSYIITIRVQATIRTAAIPTTAIPTAAILTATILTKCFCKGPNPNHSPNPLHYPFRNVKMVVVKIAAVGIAGHLPTVQRQCWNVLMVHSRSPSTLRIATNCWISKKKHWFNLIWNTVRQHVLHVTKRISNFLKKFSINL